jgi:hypothetical protein
MLQKSDTTVIYKISTTSNLEVYFLLILELR